MLCRAWSLAVCVWCVLQSDSLTPFTLWQSTTESLVQSHHCHNICLHGPRLVPTWLQQTLMSVCVTHEAFDQPIKERWLQLHTTDVMCVMNETCLRSASICCIANLHHRIDIETHYCSSMRRTWSLKNCSWSIWPEIEHVPKFTWTPQSLWLTPEQCQFFRYHYLAASMYTAAATTKATCMH